MLLPTLAQNPLFDGFTPVQLKVLAGLFTEVSFQAGQQVFGQGDPAHRVYVLEAGEMALLLHPEDGGCLTIAQIGPQGILGWSAVLGRVRYSAFAVCTQDARALTALGSDVRGLMQGEPALGRLLLGRMALTVAGRNDGTHSALTRVIQAEITQDAQ
jgi:CRP-like cAMP-binding protein